MKVVIAGGTGFIGSSLTADLRQRGHDVIVLSRTAGSGRMTWNDLACGGLPPCDAVVNLAGQHILTPGRRWTEAFKREVIESRLRSTGALVDAINKAAAPPEVFLSTSGKCFYGTGEGGRFDETCASGQDFPGQLCARWESVARKIDTGRVRYVQVRIAIVLGETGGRILPMARNKGILPILCVPFGFGLGAVFGHGRQYLPWIHIHDMVRLLVHAIENRQMHGVYNAVAPGIVTNREFAQRLARILRRPLLIRLPRWLIRWAVGRDRAGILIDGQHVVPRRTLETNFCFNFPHLDGALRDLISRKRPVQSRSAEAVTT